VSVVFHWWVVTVLSCVDLHIVWAVDLYIVLISRKKKRGWYMAFSDIYTQPL
jgi:hypothetical protein